MFQSDDIQKQTPDTYEQEPKEKRQKNEKSSCWIVDTYEQEEPKEQEPTTYEKNEKPSAEEYIRMSKKNQNSKDQ